MEGTTANTARSERVRFVAPAVLAFDGYDEEFSVEIVNLSGQGAGIIGPDGLDVGNQILLRFRLTLCDEPAVYRCRVLWRQTISRQQARYGLGFVQLPNPSRKALNQAVEERSEGKALAWSGWGQEVLLPDSLLPTKASLPAKGAASTASIEQGRSTATASTAANTTSPRIIQKQRTEHAAFVVQGAPPLPAASYKQTHTTSSARQTKRWLLVGLLCGLSVGIWLPQPNLPQAAVQTMQRIEQQMRKILPQVNLVLPVWLSSLA